MELSKLLSAIRAVYVIQLSRVLEEMAEGGQKVLSEVVLRDKDGEPAREGSLKLPMRIDAVRLQGDEPTEVVSVNSSQRLNFSPMELLWSGNLPVELHPFRWDALEVQIAGKTPPSWEPLKAWFTRWFAQGDDGAGKPIGVIHFVSDPTPDEAGHRLSIDLGTAPADALEGLLDVALALRAERVVLTTSSASRD